MLYITTRLLTEDGAQSFSILAASGDKKRAAAIAAESYRAYNEAASLRNIEMVAEWLETRGSYSFRKDKAHRLQLAITALAGERPEPGQEIVFSAKAEEDELMRRVSEILFEGRHTASPARPSACPLEG